MDDLMHPLGYIATMARNDLECSIYGDVCVYGEDLEETVAIYTEDQMREYAEQVRKDYSFTHAQMWLKRFDAAIQAENEACAKLCERLDLEGVSLGGEPAPAYASDCAKAIRERQQGIQSENCNCPGFCTGACEKGNV